MYAEQKIKKIIASLLEFIPLSLNAFSQNLLFLE